MTLAAILYFKLKLKIVLYPQFISIINPYNSFLFDLLIVEKKIPHIIWKFFLFRVHMLYNRTLQNASGLDFYSILHFYIVSIMKFSIGKVKAAIAILLFFIFISLNYKKL